MIFILIPVIVILIPVLIIIKELVKCWWRATEEWREKLWKSKQ